MIADRYPIRLMCASRKSQRYIFMHIYYIRICNQKARLNNLFISIPIHDTIIHVRNVRILYSIYIKILFWRGIR